MTLKERKKNFKKWRKEADGHKMNSKNRRGWEEGGKRKEKRMEEKKRERKGGECNFTVNCMVFHTEEYASLT